MPKRRASCRPDPSDAPPEQAVVEQAIRAAVERLKPKPVRGDPPKSGR